MAIGKKDVHVQWLQAIVEVLMDHKGGEVGLQTIYFEIRRYRTLTDNDLRITYGQENYKHMIRSLLTRKDWGLVAEDRAVKVRRGVYALSESVCHGMGLGACESQQQHHSRTE